MNPREVVLVSTATVLGALASALALRFFSSFKPKLSASHSSSNGEAAEKCISQSPFDPSKRKRYLSWDDYFMAIAFLSAERSKDPNRQASATMDFPEDVQMTSSHGPRLKSKNGDPLETKYPYVCHAEVNAILNTNHASAAGQRLYVTMYPCNECAKIIIQSGVTEVIYFVEKNMSSSDVAYVASRKLLSLAGVKVRKHQPQMDRIFIKFQEDSR
ncbi:Deoxycytidylate deaminase [Linum perenne]